MSEHDDDFELSAEDLQELDDIDATLIEEVFPIIEGLDDQHPEHSAWFAMFVNTLHALFYQGWTKEELLEEIELHHEVFLREEAEDEVPPAHELH